MYKYIWINILSLMLLNGSNQCGRFQKSRWRFNKQNKDSPWVSFTGVAAFNVSETDSPKSRGHFETDWSRRGNENENELTLGCRRHRCRHHLQVKLSQPVEGWERFETALTVLFSLPRFDCCCSLPVNSMWDNALLCVHTTWWMSTLLYRPYSL